MCKARQHFLEVHTNTAPCFTKMKMHSHYEAPVSHDYWANGNVSRAQLAGSGRCLHIGPMGRFQPCRRTQVEPLET